MLAKESTVHLRFLNYIEIIFDIALKSVVMYKAG